MRLFPVLLLASVLSGSSCRSTGAAPAIVQPGAPGEAARVVTPQRAADLSRVQHTEADVRFMQGMMAHHAQALDMTALVPARTSRDAMRLLARRIEASQADEIAMIKEWLAARGEQAVAAHAHGDHGGALMPGMLTAAEMARLEKARGDDFDRLFLELMIKHHDGALVMVEDLFATERAGQEPDVFAFASDVEADQQMEIDRMAAMLAALTVKEPRR